MSGSKIEQRHAFGISSLDENGQMVKVQKKSQAKEKKWQGTWGKETRCTANQRKRQLSQWKNDQDKPAGDRIRRQILAPSRLRGQIDIFAYRHRSAKGLHDSFVLSWIGVHLIAVALPLVSPA